MFSGWLSQMLVTATLLVPALTVASGSARAETLSIDGDTHGDFVVHYHMDRATVALTVTKF